jgi:DNA polymerase III delta subunit
MIYSIVGTHKDIRAKAYKEFSLLGEPSTIIYSDNADQIEMHLGATSLFGGVTIVACYQVSDTGSSKEKLLALLPRMESSATIFIIDEPFADVKVTNALSKLSKRYINAKEEKIKEVKVFAFCDSFAKRDKKQAWLQFIELRDAGEEGEAIQGALWWKWKDVWQGVRDGRRSPFTLSECEHIGRELVLSVILAHRGEVDLMKDLERIILSL